MYTLIVIDMQPAFYHAKSFQLIKNVMEEIDMAKLNKAAIVFVEYEQSGSTLGELTRRVRSYPMFEVTSKNRDCGAAQVVDTLDKMMYNKQILRIAGVNTDVCVKDTVLGLTRLLPDARIEVVRKACNGPRDDFSWVNFKKGILV